MAANRISFLLATAAFLACLSVGPDASADVPGPVAAPGEAQIVFINADGAQIYECKRGESATLAWRFREPVASLFENGRTVGRHYAGPTWELDDGSRITGKVAARASGAGSGDIPLLRLEVVTRSGKGLISAATPIQRLNTRGGVAEGACDRDGAFLSVPYSADYTFLKRKE